MTDVFEYEGYKIPVELVEMTGGGPDTWDVISVGHMDQYERYCPILADHDVLEIGCGVGRDAIQLTRTLSPAGSYVGVDIIRPSIEWCQGNITTRFPNFRFEYLDIHSQIHNPVGTAAVTEVTLPVADDSIDRIVLQSVFTHMFEGDIVHYLHEFRRVLRDDGRVLVALPAPDDLIELRSYTGQAGRNRVERTVETFAHGFTLVEQRRASTTADLDAAAVQDVLFSIYRPIRSRPVEAMRVTFSLDLLLFRAA